MFVTKAVFTRCDLTVDLSTGGLTTNGAAVIRDGVDYYADPLPQALVLTAIAPQLSDSPSKPARSASIVQLALSTNSRALHEDAAS